MPSRLRYTCLQTPQPLSYPSHRCQCQTRARQFSSTPRHATRRRDEMFRWLNGPGSAFRHPLPGSTNYLNAYGRDGRLIRSKDRSPRTLDQDKKTKDDPPLPKESVEDLMPFPMNREFRSQTVLSEELKDAIYGKVMEEGQSVRNVSAALGVEMNRVAAVVRLKAVEKEWEKEGKPIAFSYAKGVLGMLPTTPYVKNDPVTHESINDLPVHRATESQIFHPVSESRHFTRRDAGRVFDSDLKPAEDRVPHTELVQLEKWRYEGVQRDERLQKQREKDAKEIQSQKVLELKRKEKEARDIKKVETERSEFRFQDIQIDKIGLPGRAKEGVGVRYGMPHEDRKKGQIKIPRRVV